MMLPMIFSSGCPFFSYIASRKNGSSTTIMHMDAALVPHRPFEQKEKRHAHKRPAAKADQLPFWSD